MVEGMTVGMCLTVPVIYSVLISHSVHTPKEARRNISFNCFKLNSCGFRDNKLCKSEPIYICHITWNHSLKTFWFVLTVEHH